jgi:hypothetical protein
MDLLRHYLEHELLGVGEEEVTFSGLDELLAHISSGVNKHTAEQISVSGDFPNIPGANDNVAEVIAGVNTQLGLIGADLSYTNAEPSVIEVGGIAVGTTFDSMTYPQFVDLLLYPELFGTLTAPSSTFTSSVTGYKEIGEVVASIVFASAFNRGSISPQYLSSSPYRSGLPSEYQFSGTSLSNQTKSDLTDSQTISGYTVLSGNQTWQGRVAYGEGVQPKGSKGTDYDTPLAAGATSYVSRTITGVYPYFATTVAVGTLTKQTLASMSSSYVQTNMAGEAGTDKQTVEFPTSWSALTGIQFYNTVSSTWEWINGSKAASLLTFSQSSVTNDVQGSTINYNRYTHNGAFIGARYLRWYTT